MQELTDGGIPALGNCSKTILEKIKQLDVLKKKCNRNQYASNSNDGSECSFEGMDLAFLD